MKSVINPYVNPGKVYVMPNESSLGELLKRMYTQMPILNTPGFVVEPEEVVEIIQTKYSGCVKYAMLEKYKNDRESMTGEELEEVPEYETRFASMSWQELRR